MPPSSISIGKMYDSHCDNDLLMQPITPWMPDDTADFQSNSSVASESSPISQLGDRTASAGLAEATMLGSSPDEASQPVFTARQASGALSTLGMYSEVPLKVGRLLLVLQFPRWWIALTVYSSLERPWLTKAMLQNRHHTQVCVKELGNCDLHAPCLIARAACLPRHIWFKSAAMHKSMHNAV